MRCPQELFGSHWWDLLGVASAVSGRGPDKIHYGFLWAFHGAGESQAGRDFKRPKGPIRLLTLSPHPELFEGRHKTFPVYLCSPALFLICIIVVVLLYSSPLFPLVFPSCPWYRPLCSPWQLLFFPLA